MTRQEAPRTQREERHRQRLVELLQRKPLIARCPQLMISVP